MSRAALAVLDLLHESPMAYHRAYLRAALGATRRDLRWLEAEGLAVRSGAYWRLTDAGRWLAWAAREGFSLLPWQARVSAATYAARRAAS